MKIITFNVSGLGRRAKKKKKLQSLIKNEDVDFVCLQ